MNEREELVHRASLMNVCPDGFSGLSSCENNEQLVKYFYDNIDFCLAMNFPSKRKIRKHFYKEAREKHIYVDEVIELHNLETVVLLGTSEAIIEIGGFSVGRFYVKQDSTLKVIASDNAIVMIDALDNSSVHVEIKDRAKVVVNLYSKASCAGQAKVVHKHMETYDLQTGRG